MTATSTHIEPRLSSSISQLDDLRGRIAGKVILPHEPGYDESRTLWNGMIDKRPAIIVRPAGVADVIQAVRFATEQDLSLSIRGGGHNVAGHAISDGGLTIDMRDMSGIYIDPLRRTARVEAGATWSDFDREASVFGLATTGGVVSSTGVAGLTLGGGIGWLVGKHGLSVDNLLSVDLVTADGDVLHASEIEHPDLFWALRGGGGNFGVVTSFEFKLHPVSEVLGGIIVWPVEDAAEVLDFYRDFTESNPEEMTTYFQMGPDPETGVRVALLVVFYPEVSDAGWEQIERVRSAFKEPLVDTIGPIAYRDWQQVFEEEMPHGLRYYWKGVLLDSLSPKAMQTIVKYGTESPIPGAGLAIEHYRGVMNRVDPAATAFANRDARYQVVIVGGWEHEDEDEVGIAWVREFNQALEPYSLRAAFLNFNSSAEDEKQAVVRAGYRQNFDRLVEVKRRYDPQNVFRQNNNIRPE